METVACNLCGCTGYRHYATIHDLWFERMDVEATLVQCIDCGLVYQNPRPIPSEMGQHYLSGYEAYVDPSDAIGGHWLARRAIDYGVQKRCRFVTKHKVGGSLLDIGCAGGTFLLGMQQQDGWETVGVEVSDEVAEIARKRRNLNVFTGTLEQAQFADEQFDAVTLWDVLEHLHDPAASLREIHRILRPAGIVVIRVPNLDSWDARFFGDEWAGLDAPRHLYVFSSETLSRLLMQNGFDVLSRSGAIGGYAAFVLSVRFRQTASGAAPRMKELVRRILQHPVTSLASAPFFYLPSKLLCGPLIVMTARKAQHG